MELDPEIVEKMLSVKLTGEMFIAEDGYPGLRMRTDQEAAEIAARVARAIRDEAVTDALAAQAEECAELTEAAKAVLACEEWADGTLVNTDQAALDKALDRLGAALDGRGTTRSELAVARGLLARIAADEVIRYDGMDRLWFQGYLDASIKLIPAEAALLASLTEETEG